MHDASFVKAVEEICGKDHRYDPEAYFFLREALFFTAKMLEKPVKGPGRHVSGRELLEGIRTYALQEFGPMSLTVLNTWGLKKTDDFGEIVFNMVEAGKLGRTDTDRKDDFVGGYDFYQAFAVPFLPAQPRAGGKGKTHLRKRSKRSGGQSGTEGKE